MFKCLTIKFEAYLWKPNFTQGMAINLQKRLRINIPLRDKPRNIIGFIVETLFQSWEFLKILFSAWVQVHVFVYFRKYLFGVKLIVALSGYIDILAIVESEIDQFLFLTFTWIGWINCSWILQNILDALLYDVLLVLLFSVRSLLGNSPRVSIIISLRFCFDSEYIQIIEDQIGLWHIVLWIVFNILKTASVLGRPIFNRNRWLRSKLIILVSFSCKVDALEQRIVEFWQR